VPGYDSELDRFKRDINLTEFAAARGYALDRRESSSNSAVMRHPDGDKIIVARNEGNGHWIYFSIRSDADNGTIIDFLQNRGGGGLGDARKALRAWQDGTRPAVSPLVFAPDLLPISRDRATVLAAWGRARVCVDHPYLTSRGLGPEVLGLPRFAGRVRIDGRGAALFPHYDREGLCGFEAKNTGFTGFSAGGVKGLWSSKTKATDNRLVLAESAIDALSFHVLRGDGDTRYMSTGGSLNPRQPDLLRGAMDKLPVGAVVLLAFDNDEGGNQLAAEVAALAPAGRDVQRALPDTGKDWNDALRRQLRM